MSLKTFIIVILSLLLLSGSSAVSDYGYCTTDQYLFTNEEGQIIGIWDFNKQMCYSPHLTQDKSFTPISLSNACY